LRILVADDEPIEREALRVLVQRNMPEAQVVGEAGTGAQAIALTEQLHPDVVFMDIEMPGLSGLQALREIRQRCPDTRCVVVSAYDYFHFAREALRLGVVDYLLKPVKRDEMLAVLRRLADDIAAHRGRRQQELQQQEQLQQLRPLAEAQLVQLMVAGAPEDQINSLLQVLGLKFQAGFCMVAGIAEQPGQEAREAEAAAAGDPRQAYLYLRSLAHSLCTCAVGAWEDSRTVLMVELNAPVDEYETRIWSSDLAQRLRDLVKGKTGIRFRVGIGRYFSGISEAPRSYKEALNAFRFEGLSHRVTHYGDLVGQEGNGWRPTPAVLRAVERGKEYIREHFREDVALEQVAREVCLTPYYFSKVFSRVTGETLMDYLTRVRVEEAKRLLADPNISIKEACYQVGYNDPNYFSRVFKKVTGQTPTEFRNRLA